MANVRVFVPGPLLPPNFDTGDVTSANSNRVVVDGNNFRVVFLGNFVLGATIEDMTGTLDGWRYYQDGALVLTVTDANVNVATFVTLLDNDDFEGAIDLIWGGPDQVIASDGTDQVASFGGNDTIISRDGDDTVDAGGGNDSVRAGGDDDTVFGRSGNDTLLGNGGNDLLAGNVGRDVLRGGGGSDTLLGGGNDDTLLGNGGDDLIRGGGGADVLDGGGQHDILRGGSGNDTIIGGRGNDDLAGDAGNDEFRFGSGDGDDTVRGFNAGLDHVLITSGASSFGEVTVDQVGAHAVLSFDDVTVTFLDTDAGDLTGANVLF